MANVTCLLIDSKDGVLDITLNRPEVHNAFNETLIAELTACIRDAEPGVRAIILRGAGPSFCAGADLHWMGRMAHYSYEENLADARALKEMFAAIAHSPAVTLAVVHGAAIGGGAGLAAVCDLVIATPDARFALSEVRLGLVPAIIAPYVLQKVGPGAARALFVTGERFDGEEAHRIGLVQQVVPAEQIEQAVAQKLALIRQAGPQAVAVAKRLLRDIAGKSPDEAGEITVECIANLRVGAEGQEGMQAFLEKRRPNFAG